MFNTLKVKYQWTKVTSIHLFKQYFQKTKEILQTLVKICTPTSILGFSNESMKGVTFFLLVFVYPIVGLFEKNIGREHDLATNIVTLLTMWIYSGVLGFAFSSLFTLDNYKTLLKLRGFSIDLRNQHIELLQQMGDIRDEQIKDYKNKLACRDKEIVFFKKQLNDHKDQQKKVYENN